MKQKIKNDTTLAERMYWSLILSFAAFFSIFRINYPQPTSSLPKAPEEVRIVVILILSALSFVLLINFFLGIFRRKHNKKAIEDIKLTGMKVTGKVEDVIQKGISIKYILKVSFPSADYSETLTGYTPLLHKDPRHHTTVGSEVDVYLDMEDEKNFYIDITD